ncbi:hypothetical protein QTL95_05370 [Rhizobium sp. S152]|uniref:hypothetical protein n=1 Tax=Rhizobium sp. S152 TaxID=3055038 RepID=UPI0025A9A390|nr:hypothetical protein [Rhizobium sp. S152]MDM9625312.1 hypothetical protein [Rhizobium sp. S152]
MTKVVVIGIAGEKGLWVADLTAGTVKPLDPPANGGLKAAADKGAAGAPVTKGLSVAVVVKSAADAFAGHYAG